MGDLINKESFLKAQNSHERFLRNFNFADGFHALFTGFLLFEQLALTSNVAAIAFSGRFPHRFSLCGKTYCRSTPELALQTSVGGLYF